MIRTLVLPPIIAALLLAVACSGDDAPEPTPTSVATALPPTATVPAETSPQPASPTPMNSPTVEASPTQPPSTGGGLESLSLVYVDTRRGQGGDIYVADADGANARLVKSEPAFRRPLAVMGGTLAAVGTGGVLLIGLEGGEASTLDETLVVFDGRFMDDETFLYSISGGCTQGGGVLKRVDVRSREVEDLVTSDLSLTIAGFDLNTGTITLLPRGCDVGVASLAVYDAETGELRNTLAVEGCGWAVAVPEHNKAVVSRQSCNPVPGHEGADATVYDFGIVGPTGNDVTAPDEGSNAAIWLPRPGAPEVALGTTMTSGSGPGSTRAAGIYLLDLTNREFTKVVEGEGAEQFPVAWSPDGRYLLYSIVEAQGVCRYAYIDVDAPGAKPVAINPEITLCGVNGNVAGWTELP